MELPGLPTGVVLTEGPELVVCLDDGLHVVDPDAGSSRLLAPYPNELHGRANDANADGHGGLVTGTLNLSPGPGSLCRFSLRDGWSLLDDDFGNANGPVVLDGTLVCGDTVAGLVYAYPYDGTAGERRVLGDHRALDGAPDGATVDADGGVWSTVVRSGKLVRLAGDGPGRIVDVPVANPSDLAFGEPALDRLYLTSIAVDLGIPPGPEAGRLLRLDGLGTTGRPEHRFALR